MARGVWEMQKLQGPVRKQKRRRGKVGVGIFGHFGDALSVMGGENARATRRLGMAANLSRSGAAVLRSFWNGTVDKLRRFGTERAYAWGFGGFEATLQQS